MRKASFDRNRKDSEIEVGQKVLWNINASFAGNKRKLGPRWIGPYEVVKVFNDGQSLRIKVIDLPPEDTANPMNPHKIPRRKQTIDTITPIEEFYVPRNQVKPYFARFEDRVSGDVAPAVVAINALSTIA